MRNSVVILLLILLVSCKKNEPRYPVQYGKESALAKSIAVNKALFKQENKQIKRFIAQDSVLNYTNSEKGFWHATLKTNKKGNFPVKGDLVLFEKEISGLDGTVYFSKETLGVQQYYVDKEHTIKGIKEGIKLMREGETFKFVFSSFVAYRMNGDKTNTIGSNEPIICEITLKKINKNN